MPYYEYDCLTCGLRTEVNRPMSQHNVPYTCECGSPTKKVVVAPAVHMPTDGSFKGSGKNEMDKRIGKSAEERWDRVNKEAALKKDVRESNHNPALGRTTDGKYVPLNNQYMDNRSTLLSKAQNIINKGTKIGS